MGIATMGVITRATRVTGNCHIRARRRGIPGVDAACYCARNPPSTGNVWPVMNSGVSCGGGAVRAVAVAVVVVAAPAAAAGVSSAATRDGRYRVGVNQSA